MAACRVRLGSYRLPPHNEAHHLEEERLTEDILIWGKRRWLKDIPEMAEKACPKFSQKNGGITMFWELILIMAVFFGTCGLGALLMVIEHWWSKRKRRREREAEARDGTGIILGEPELIQIGNVDDLEEAYGDMYKNEQDDEE